MRCQEMFEAQGKANAPPTFIQCRLEYRHGKVHECRSPRGGLIRWRKRANHGQK